MANGETNTEQSPRPTCSIAFAMGHVACDAGIQLSLDDLCSALGLPWLFCVAKDDISSEDGPFLARDMFLMPAARALGMTVREIHPPAAAHNLHGKQEFLQHFKASYAPLVARALENGQSVLAWRGWCGEEDRCWGLITDTCNEGIGLRGSVWLDDSQDGQTKNTFLENPPVQVYVVEHVDPMTPSADELATLVLCHVRAILNDERGPEFRVITGPHAFRTLLASIEGTPERPAVGSVDLRHDARNLRFFVDDLEIGLRSLRRCLSQTSRAVADRLGELLGWSEKLYSAFTNVVRLGKHDDPQPAGQTDPALHEALTQAIELSEAMRDSLQSLPTA